MKAKKHAPIQVCLMTHDPMTVEAEQSYCPYFCVHRTVGSERYWSITHIPTGSKIGGYLPRRVAHPLAAAIGAVMDWSGADEGELKKRYIALPQGIQRWARSFARGVER